MRSFTIPLSRTIYRLCRASYLSAATACSLLYSLLPPVAIGDITNIQASAGASTNSTVGFGSWAYQSDWSTPCGQSHTGLLQNFTFACTANSSVVYAWSPDFICAGTSSADASVLLKLQIITDKPSRQWLLTMTASAYGTANLQVDPLCWGYSNPTAKANANASVNFSVDTKSPLRVVTSKPTPGALSQEFVRAYTRFDFARYWNLPAVQIDLNRFSLGHASGGSSETESESVRIDVQELPFTRVFAVGVNWLPDANIRGDIDAQKISQAFKDYVTSYTHSDFSVVQLVSSNGSSYNRQVVDYNFSGFANSVQEGDTVVLYFSSHGNLLPSGLYNVRLGNTRDGGMPDSLFDLHKQDLESYLSRLPSTSRKILIFDTCHSGGFEFDLQNAAVLAAAPRTGTTFAHPADGTGIFTSVLINELKAKTFDLEDLATKISETSLGSLLGQWSWTKDDGEQASITPLHPVVNRSPYFDGDLVGPALICGTGCLGDLNCDGVVSDPDFSIFSVSYNVLDCSDITMPKGCLADLNRDQVVDDLDFALFIRAYDIVECS